MGFRERLIVSRETGIFVLENDFFRCDRLSFFVSFDVWGETREERVIYGGSCEGGLGVVWWVEIEGRIDGGGICKSRRFGFNILS